MKKLMIAVAMTIALPAAAFAQATPAPATSGHAGHDMPAMSCKDMKEAMASGHAGHQMSGTAGQMDHSKMDHSKMAAAHGCGDTAKAGAAAADPHAGHKQ